MLSSHVPPLLFRAVLLSSSVRLFLSRSAKKPTGIKNQKNEEKIHLFFVGRREPHKNAQAFFGKKSYFPRHPALLAKAPFRGPSAPSSVAIDFSLASANKRHKLLLEFFVSRSSSPAVPDLSYVEYPSAGHHHRLGVGFQCWWLLAGDKYKLETQLFRCKSPRNHLHDSRSGNTARIV